MRCHDSELACDNRHNQQSRAQKKNEQIRQQGGNDKAPAPDGNAMKKNHRHRVFEHGKSQGAEQDHRAEQHGADDLLVRQKSAQLFDQGRGLAGHDKFQILSHRR